MTGEKPESRASEVMRPPVRKKVGRLPLVHYKFDCANIKKLSPKQWTAFKKHVLEQFELDLERLCKPCGTK
jgi:hypothetical protein